MKAPEQLMAFVEEGLRAGHDPDTLRRALLAEGWSQAETASALDAWGDHGLGVPVPRRQSRGAGQETVLYGLMFVSLLVLTWNLVSLGFDLIELWVPDPLQSDQRAWSGQSMRWAIAMLVVALPVFLWLNRRTARALAADPGHRNALVRHRFGALTLFLATLTLLGAAVAVVYAGLMGVVTAQFMAKLALVVTIAGLMIAWFRDFLADA